MDTGTDKDLLEKDTSIVDGLESGEPGEDISAEGEPEAGTEGEPEGEPAEEVQQEIPPKKGGVQAKIDKMTAEKYRMKEENHALQAELARIRAEKAVSPAETAPAPKHPDVELMLDNPVEYNRQRDIYETYRGNEIAKSAATATRDLMKKEEQERKSNERMANVRREAMAFEARHPDFQNVAGIVGNAPTAMADAILDAESPAAVSYHLGKNPSEFQRISGLTPIQQIKEIGRLELALKSKPANKAKQNPKPPTVLGKSGKTIPDDGSFESLVAARRAQRETK